MRDIAKNEQAATDPQPGDYWHEMSCAICLVVARDNEWVCVCRRKQDCADGKWFVFVDPEWMKVSEFEEWLSYKQIPGYWADVAKRRLDVSAYTDYVNLIKPHLLDPSQQVIR